MKFNQNPSSEAELFHADGRTDGRTEGYDEANSFCLICISSLTVVVSLDRILP